jgi:hypothetical protein
MWNDYDRESENPARTGYRPPRGAVDAGLAAPPVDDPLGRSPQGRGRRGRQRLTLEDFAGWQRSIDRSGMPGLRVTRIQHYRDLYERQQRF